MKSLFKTPLALLLSLCLLAGCDRLPSWAKWQETYADLTRTFPSKPLPNPVQSKGGVSYIPIDDTAFLIPEETWLRGYGRKSTDGMVSSIALHSTVPDVQPWSKARHEEMYWPAGPGKKLLITIKGNEVGAYRDNFHKVPTSGMLDFKFIEEPSDQAEQGLRRFRRSWGEYTEEDAKEGLKKFGQAHVESMRGHANKPMMHTVYYEYIQSDRVKYFIYCSDGKGGIFQTCYLSFPWARTLMIDIEFNRTDITHIVAMTDKVADRLREFEAAGLVYRATQPSSASSTPRP